MPNSNDSPRSREWHALQDKIRALLCQHGRHTRADGDYWLEDQDAGTYELKVLVFRNILTPELLESVWASLWDYSHEWRVAFIAANEDGTEMVAAGGLRVSANGPEMLNPPEITPEDWEKTKDLYDALSTLLGPHGTSDAFGHGDYWIVDDFYGPFSQKVCIFNIGFLSPRLAEEVRQLLENRFPECVVWCQMEVEEPGVDVPLPGIRVYADRIEHDWDREKLRSDFKDRFPW